MACAYFFTGYFSNSLLSVDGYAVASWPPSGIALASFLIWGRKSFIGLIIGAFCTNLIHLEHTVDIFHFIVLLQAIGITLASVLQAWIGRQIIVNVIKAPLDLSSLKHSVQSLIVAGPICCVIAAGVGTSLLALNNVIPTNAIFDNFIAWWIGDSIGVLIFTPLVLAAFNYTQVRHRMLVILPSLLIYILISVSFYGAASVKKEKDIQKQEAKILSVQNAISQKLDGITAHLGLLATFFASSSDVDFKEFKQFTSKQLGYSQEILAFEWIPYIPANKLADFETHENPATGKPLYIKEKSLDGAWQPAGTRSNYFPVKYVYPLKGNEDVLGFDLASSKVRGAALSKAKELNELALSEPINLVQNTAEHGVLFLYPVFGESSTEDDFKGFVAAIVSLKRLSQTLLFDHNNSISASFFDTTIPGKKQAIYIADTANSQALFKEYQLLIGKRMWQVELYEPIVRTSWLVYWLAQIVGMLFVWLLITFLISVTGTNIQIREQVAKQTHTLRKEKQKADEASHIKG